jgi:hypothetical protein
MLPIKAFAESARRMAGLRRTTRRRWPAGCASRSAQIATTWARRDRAAIAPAFGGSLAGLPIFVACLALAWGAALPIVGAPTAVLFAAIVVRVYDAGSGAAAARVPGQSHEATVTPGDDAAFVRESRGRARRRRGARHGGDVSGHAQRMDRPAGDDLAHRGASDQAPENTLADRLASDPAPISSS